MPDPELRDALQLACQPTRIDLIVEGRKRVLSLPRVEVIAHLERVAAEAIDWNDYWEYRRLLELTALLDDAMLQRFVRRGLQSTDPDVLEAAQDFRTAP